jgi:hypothetical protein
MHGETVKFKKSLFARTRIFGAFLKKNMPISSSVCAYPFICLWVTVRESLKEISYNLKLGSFIEFVKTLQFWTKICQQ